MMFAAGSVLTPSEFEEMVLERTATVRQLLSAEQRNNILELLSGTSDMNKDLEKATNDLFAAISLTASITYPEPEQKEKKDELMIAMLIYKLGV